MAVGFEQMVPGALQSLFPDRPNIMERHLNAIIKIANVTEEQTKGPGTLVYFTCQMNILKDQYGVKDRTFAHVAVKARRHAANNPYSIFRDPLTEEEYLSMPLIFGKLRKLDACPPSCGAASVIVCNEKFAKQHGIRTDVRLAGEGWVSDLPSFIEGDPLDVAQRGIVRYAAKKAYEEAGVGPDDVDVVEMHDCFTCNEVTGYLGLGLCKEDNLEQFVMEDQNTYGGKVVVNPSGGLLSKGHPIGATGLAQITELTWQLRGEAGPRQVEGARIALQNNSGLGSSVFVRIFERH